jgi:hypothetical protein
MALRPSEKWRRTSDIILPESFLREALSLGIDAAAGADILGVRIHISPWLKDDEVLFFNDVSRYQPQHDDVMDDVMDAVMSFADVWRRGLFITLPRLPFFGRIQIPVRHVWQGGDAGTTSYNLWRRQLSIHEGFAFRRGFPWFRWHLYICVKDRAFRLSVAWKSRMYAVSF